MKNEKLYLQHTYTYMALRKTVGWIGITLPFTLMFGNFLIFKGELMLRSISVYYYSEMRDVFVSALAAIAIFMFFYSGYGNKDKYVTTLAGILTLGVIFFPTTLVGKTDLIGMVHYACAASLFLLLAGISIFNFPRKRPGIEKQLTDKIQVICGLVMIGCVIAAAVYFTFFHIEGHETCFVFVSESIALIAFGVSWLTEGWDLRLEIT